MALVRLAKPSDYVAFHALGRTMYRLSWHDGFCPGNPADTPEEGVEQFNAWQMTIAAGASPEAKTDSLETIVSWCLKSEGEGAHPVARELVHAYTNKAYRIPFPREPERYNEEQLTKLYEIAFLNDLVKELPAQVVLKLRNLYSGKTHDQNGTPRV